MRHRLAAILPVYFVVMAACYAVAFQLRFDFDVPQSFRLVFWSSLPFVLILKAAGCVLTGEWRRTYRYASISDIAALGIMTFGTTIAFLFFNLIPFGDKPVPRSIIITDAILSLLVLGFV